MTPIPTSPGASWARACSPSTRSTRWSARCGVISSGSSTSSPRSCTISRRRCTGTSLAVELILIYRSSCRCHRIPPSHTPSPPCLHLVPTHSRGTYLIALLLDLHTPLLVPFTSTLTVRLLMSFVACSACMDCRHVIHLRRPTSVKPACNTSHSQEPLTRAYGSSACFLSFHCFTCSSIQ